MPIELLPLTSRSPRRLKKGEPDTAFGVPKNYPDAKKLLAVDCIRPAATERATK